MRRIFATIPLFLISLSIFATTKPIPIPVPGDGHVVDHMPLTLTLEPLEQYPETNFMVSCTLTTTGADTQINFKSNSFGDTFIVDKKKIGNTASLVKKDKYSFQAVLFDISDYETPYIIFKNINSDPAIISNCSALAQ